MKRTHLLTSAALGLALLAAPAALAQRGGAGGDAAASAQDGGDGPAELLRRAQSAMREGRTARAAEMLERAETRLLAGVEPGEPKGGEPAFHASQARRALANRDRAEAMRETNLAIATARGGSSAGNDAGNRGAAESGGPGAVDTGMGLLRGVGSGGRAVVRDSDVGGTSVSRAEGVVLAQSDGARGLPPGDSIPGWSGLRGGTGTGTGGPYDPPPGPATPGVGTPGGGTAGRAMTPGSLIPGGAPNVTSGPSSSSIIGGAPARIGGAPPGGTPMAPGSSGISGGGVGTPIR